MTDALLSLIAGRFGTPTYVYDLDVVTEQVARLAAAFPFADIRYAVKANANGALLRHLVSLGVGAEALTEGELERALRAGFAPARIVLGGPGHTPRSRGGLRRPASDSSASTRSESGGSGARRTRPTRVSSCASTPASTPIRTST